MIIVIYFFALTGMVFVGINIVLTIENIISNKKEKKELIKQHIREQGILVYYDKNKNVLSIYNSPYKIQSLVSTIRNGMSYRAAIYNTKFKTYTEVKLKEIFKDTLKPNNTIQGDEAKRIIVKLLGENIYD